MGLIIVDKNTDIVVRFVEEMSIEEVDQYLADNPDHDVLVDTDNKLLNSAFSLDDDDDDDIDD